MRIRKWTIVALAVLNLCLLGFAVDRLAPAGDVAQAAAETHPALLSAGRAVEPARAARPLAVIATGLVCVVFGVIAVSPLLLGNPEQCLREAN